MPTWKRSKEASAMRDALSNDLRAYAAWTTSPSGPNSFTVTQDGKTYRVTVMEQV